MKPNELSLLDLMNEYDVLKRRLADVESAIKAHQKHNAKEQLQTAFAILEKINNDNIFGDDDYFSDDLNEYINLTTLINCLGSFIEEVVK